MNDALGNERPLGECINTPQKETIDTPEMTGGHDDVETRTISPSVSVSEGEAVANEEAPQNDGSASQAPVNRPYLISLSFLKRKKSSKE